MNAQRMSVSSYFLQIQDLWADYGGHCGGGTRMPKHYAVTDVLNTVRQRKRLDQPSDLASLLDKQICYICNLAISAIFRYHNRREHK